MPSKALRTVQMLAVLAMVAALPAACQEAASQVGSEIERLQRAVHDKPAWEPIWKDAKPGLARSLSQAGEELRAGRLYLSLEQVGQARTALRSLESVRGGPPAGFDSNWRQAKLDLGAADKKARQIAWGEVPAAVRALAEMQQGRALIVLEASRAYAGVTGAAAGYYYLGEAKGASEQAAFLHSLTAARRGSPLAWHSLSPQLERLQAQVDAAFVPPRSIQLHGQFISLNATLKLATELDHAGLHAGALYQYLDAVEQFGLLGGAAEPAKSAEPAALRSRIAALQTQLSASKQDDSIGELFLERAAAPLGARKPGQDSWVRAAILIDQVLPAYFAALGPVPPPAQVAANAITVTLVRWPYT